MNYLTLRTTCTLCLAILLCGCAGKLKGPAFRPVAEMPEAKTVIYLYWPDENLRTQFAIKANGKSITNLKNGGYVAYVAEPGEIDLSAKVKFKLFATGILDVATSPSTKLTLTAQEGEAYYVECTGLPPKLLSLSMTSGQRLGMEVVPNELGARRIQNCKLLPSK